jgi:asparagine synthase (glutamine-hydrolysing)
VTGRSRYALAPLEVASGLVLGTDPLADRPSREPILEPRRALEEAILPALLRPPCLVSFSGGRDSSAVLAIAAALARRESLPLPVPATNRFPAVAAADESDWQERVVAHLGLEDWARVEHDHELDVVGPVATGVLRRHGLLWPFNAHFHVPLFRLAAGGSLLTGIGGDELLTPRPWTEALAAVRHARLRRPQPLLRLGFELAPNAVRKAVLRRRLPLAYPWLHPTAARELSAAWAAQQAAEPLRLRAHLAWVERLRYLCVGTGSLGLLAEEDGVRLGHPFLDPRFAAALSRAGSPATRTEAMRRLAGGLLPDDLLARESKGSFDGAFWSAPARAFAESWDGRGVDTSLVDPEALRAEWTTGSPDPRSFTLAQSVWLAQQRSRDGIEQQLEGAR